MVCSSVDDNIILDIYRRVLFSVGSNGALSNV